MRLRYEKGVDRVDRDIHVDIHVDIGIDIERNIERGR
jgi:hypothetical protein